MRAVAVRKLDAALSQAWQALEAKDLDCAERLYGEILADEPAHFEALYLLGFVHFRRRRWEAAAAQIAQALIVRPHSLDALYTRGRALLRMRREAEALSCFERALRIVPAVPDILARRAEALAGLHRPEEALLGIDRALALCPKSAEFWTIRAELMLDLHRVEEALSCARKALSFGHNNAKAWRAQGRALARAKRFKEALDSFSLGLSICPGDAEGLTDRAAVLSILGRHDQAAGDLGKALRIDPDYPYGVGNLLLSRMKACDWSHLEFERAELEKRLVAGERAVKPFQAVILIGSGTAQKRCSEIFTRDRCAMAEEQLRRGKLYRHSRIRVAYLSSGSKGEERLLGLFRHHDKTRFETVAVLLDQNDAGLPPPSQMDGFDYCLDARGKSDAEVAALLHRMEIDIIADLTGLQEGARTHILAHRPAPVQVHVPGFPATMGAAFIDYIIADDILIGKDEEGDYSEKVVRLPETAIAFESVVPAGDEGPSSRAEAGLPEKGTVFACFNGCETITPEVFDVWMRLLANIEESALWLSGDNAIAEGNLKQAARQRGVAPERLLFAPLLGRAGHLARHRLADLFLDTFPCSGREGVADSLLGGLPALSLRGETFAGRGGASLLHAAGLCEMMARSVPEYERLALRFARDPDALAALKAKLARHRAAAFPLFDILRFVRHLEAAYAGMWERHQRARPPEAFDVSPLPGRACVPVGRGASLDTSIPRAYIRRPGPSPSRGRSSVG